MSYTLAERTRTIYTILASYQSVKCIVSVYITRVCGICAMVELLGEDIAIIIIGVGKISNVGWASAHADY